MSFYRRTFVVALLIVATSFAIASPYCYRVVCDARRNNLVERCRVLRSAGKWDDLKVLADGWTAWDATNGEAWMYRAQAAMGRKQWSDAASYYLHVPDSDSHALTAMIEVSRLAFMTLDDPLTGVEACQRMLKIDPHAAGAQKQLIGFYSTTLQREKLLNQIRAAIQARNEPREAYVHFFLLYTMRSKDAVDINERWLKTNPDEELFLVASTIQLPESTIESKDAPTTAAEGKEEGERGRGGERETGRGGVLKQAANHNPSMAGRSKMQLVDELLNRFPHNLELLAYKTDERLEAGDASAVAELLAKAPEAARRDNRFWRFKGWLHESNNEIDEAIAAYHQALELHCVDWSTMNRLAVVERRKHNITEVQRLTALIDRGNALRQALRKLKSVELVTPQILVEIANLLRDAGDKEIGPALERRLGQMESR